jgi:hypothetical protein
VLGPVDAPTADRAQSGVTRDPGAAHEPAHMLLARRVRAAWRLPLRGAATPGRSWPRRARCARVRLRRRPARIVSAAAISRYSRGTGGCRTVRIGAGGCRPASAARCRHFGSAQDVHERRRTAMVRKGSPVRVRQRASEAALQSGFRLFGATPLTPSEPFRARRGQAWPLAGAVPPLAGPQSGSRSRPRYRGGTPRARASVATARETVGEAFDADQPGPSWRAGGAAHAWS